MYSTIYTGGICGIKSYLAKVEVDMARALPGFDMVGKLSKEVSEAKERVRVALKNSGIEIPPMHITVNISPADIRKTGTSYDLAIAIGIMIAMGLIPEDAVKELMLVGELGLDGEVMPVKGVLPMVLEAKRKHRRLCIVPWKNSSEAASVEGIEIIAVKSLNDAYSYLTNPQKSEIVQVNSIGNQLIQPDYTDDFSDVLGQEACKRAALIAAAGFHHMLISGPPGSGKTMIAKRLVTILPPLTVEECLEISGVYSVAGELDETTPFVKNRPFTQPYHSITKQALTGGGVDLRPGIMSLSHKGVMFLDEFPEYSRECIEVLRGPLEDKKIKISRVYGTYTYPADFMLVAAMNPCPCGFYPNRNKCNCSENMIERYKGKISGPIRDRIDITVSAQSIDLTELRNKIADVSSETMRQQVLNARHIQSERFQNSKYVYNSQILPRDIDKYCILSDEAKEYAVKAYENMSLSVRSYHKTLKVARTIADIDGSEKIEIKHLAEALCYRG